MADVVIESLAIVELMAGLDEIKVLAISKVELAELLSIFVLVEELTISRMLVVVVVGVVEIYWIKSLVEVESSEIVLVLVVVVKVVAIVVLVSVLVEVICDPVVDNVVWIVSVVVNSFDTKLSVEPIYEIECKQALF